MEFFNERPSKARIVTSPPGRGWKRRKEITVNPEYVRTLLEQARLTERDEALMRYLSSLTVLSAQQIYRLLWFDSKFSNMSRRLRQLFDYHLVDRVRMINKADGIVYALGKAGRLWLGEARGGDGPRVNVGLISHELDLSEVLVLIQEELRWAGDECELRASIEWANEAECRVTSTKGKAMVEPDAWTKLTGQGWNFAFYLEVDRNTEGPAAFGGKVTRYLNACRHGGLRKISQTPGVVVVTTSDERADRLAELIAAQQYKIWTDHKQLPKQAQATPPALLNWFVVTLLDLQRHGFFSDEKIWRIVVPGQEKPVKQRSIAPWESWKLEHGEA